MPTRRPRKAVRPDDGRLKANRPAPKRTPVKSRYQKLIDGEINVEDLDDEEVALGRCKDKNGGWGGRPPKTFPRELHDAMHIEFRRRIQEKFNAAGDIAYTALIELATSRRVSADARFKAATYIMERIIGKIPDKVESTVKVAKFEEGIRDLLIDLPEDEIAKQRRKHA